MLPGLILLFFFQIVFAIKFSWVAFFMDSFYQCFNHLYTFNPMYTYLVKPFTRHTSLFTYLPLSFLFLSLSLSLSLSLLVFNSYLFLILAPCLYFSLINIHIAQALPWETNKRLLPTTIRPAASYTIVFLKLLAMVRVCILPQYFWSLPLIVQYKTK